MGARSGAAYVEGLRDDREVWIDGERVKDVTRDRRLGRGIKSVAGLYDLQLDPAHVDRMTYTSPTTGDRVGLSHIQPRSVDDLVRRRTMFKTWAEWAAGMMGRSPDFLNVKQFPVLSFKSTAVKASEGGYEVTGDFTLHGVTKSLTFNLTGGKTAEFPKGTMRTGYSTDLVLKRSDFDIGGGGAIGDEVYVSVSMEGVRK